MSSNKRRSTLPKNNVNFNQRKANESRSRLLLLADRECNSRYAAEILHKNSLRINCKDPDELRHNCIFYIQLDNEEYSEATEFPYINKSLLRIWNPIYPRKKKSTKSLKSSPILSDWSEDEDCNNPPMKALQNYSNYGRSPHEIKYITPIEIKIKSEKQTRAKRIMASFDILHDLASKLSIFKEKTPKALRSKRGNSQSKDEQALLGCKPKMKLSETSNRMIGKFGKCRSRNTVTYANSKIFESLYKTDSNLKIERGNTMKFNTIKHESEERQISPSHHYSLKGSIKMNLSIRKNADIPIQIKGIIPENDCE